MMFLTVVGICGTVFRGLFLLFGMILCFVALSYGIVFLFSVFVLSISHCFVSGVSYCFDALFFVAPIARIYSLFWLQYT